jgi:hypothetical protein
MQRLRFASRTLQAQRAMEPSLRLLRLILELLQRSLTLGLRARERDAWLTF